MTIRTKVTADSPLFRLMRRTGREQNFRRARRIHVMIDTDLDLALVRWAARENLSKSALIRWVLRSHLPELLPHEGDPVDSLCGIVSFEPTPPVSADAFYPSLPPAR